LPGDYRWNWLAKTAKPDADVETTAEEVFVARWSRHQSNGDAFLDQPCREIATGRACAGNQNFGIEYMHGFAHLDRCW
jgi:hypothetical protein